MYSSYTGANKYLKSFIPPGYIYKSVQALKLERISYLLKLLGNPHKTLRFIHVGGTSGKGSTAYFLSRILTDQGYKTGLHVSPHLQEISERMQINGKPISIEEFINSVNRIKPLAKIVEKNLGLGKPTYFETTVAMAFDHFAKEKVDIAVIEVGLGGKLDATNVISPLISIITNVSLDHTDILGNSVQKIAADKAGIIKKGVPVISGASQLSVRRILKKKADNLQSKLYFLGTHFNYSLTSSDLNGSEFNFNWDGKMSRNLRLSIPGIYQVKNASLALAAVHLLKGINYKISKDKLYKSINRVAVPGRFEIVKKKPLIVLDGAHNPTKIKVFLESLSKFVPRQKFILQAIQYKL